MSIRNVWSGGVAALALVGAALTATPSASASTLVGDGADDCTPQAASAARVAEGTSIGSDPNSLSGRQVAAREAALSEQLAKQGLSRSSQPRLDDGSQKIPTYVHVIRKRDGTGNTTNHSVKRQLRVLNRSFRGDTSTQSINTPFRFRLKSIDRTNNTDWFRWSIDPDTADGDDGAEAKPALHQGGFRALNLYVANLKGGVLGYATFPTGKDSKLPLDGIVLTKESLPGGNAAPYNRGDTGTHEVGHWLNLFHTFQGGCDDPGDMVEDTPRQFAGQNVFVCDETLNTCGNNDGSEALRDPVHNFMNYTDDECLDRFTFGQEERMEMAWLAYRKGK